MTQLKSLTLAALPKLTAADPVVQRRNKLIVRLQQQIQLAQDPNFTLTRQKWITDETGVKQLRSLPKKVRAWWRTDATGCPRRKSSCLHSPRGRLRNHGQLRRPDVSDCDCISFSPIISDCNQAPLGKALYTFS